MNSYVRRFCLRILLLRVSIRRAWDTLVLKNAIGHPTMIYIINTTKTYTLTIYISQNILALFSKPEELYNL
jgi:hypothetical protein